MRFSLLLLVLLAAPLTAQETGTLAPQGFSQGMEEAVALPFYDGIVATVERRQDGSFRGVLTRALDDGGTRLLARYDLVPEARQGLLIVPGRGVVRTLDYSGFRPPRGEELEAFLAAHTPASVALSMLVLWEDETAETAASMSRQLAPMEEPDGGVSFPGSPLFFRQEQRQVCPGCIANLNGCSGWLTPQYCAGTAIGPACNDHDACYQCGAFCEGRTRLECDQQFRQAILSRTGSSWCANVYYWGVRVGGWPFYEDPNARFPMHPDVYSLGIEISACEGTYAHLCTHYVM